MKRTLFAGLTQLDRDESLTTDNASFQSRNPSIIDRLLEIGAVTHRHDAHDPVDNPASAASADMLPSGGTIPADMTLYVGYTVRDIHNGETALATPAVTTSQPPIEAPTAGPEAEIDYTAGELTVDTYYYAVSVVDADGGETPASDATDVEREPGFASGQVLISGLAAILEETEGSVSWRLWRATGGGDFDLLATGTGDTFTDDGTIPCNCNVEPLDESENRTHGTNALSVIVPSGGVMDDPQASAFSIYVSEDGDFTGPGLLGTYPVASAGQEIIFTVLDTADERPPDVSTSYPGASKIDPDTELIDYHWKRPVATFGDLPTDETVEQGDVRVVLSIGVPYWATEDGGPWQELIGNADIAIGNVAASGDGSAGPASALMFIGQGGLTAEVEEASGSAVVRLTAPEAGEDNGLTEVAASGSGEVSPARSMLFQGSGGTTVEVIDQGGGSALVRITSTGDGGDIDLDLAATNSVNTTEDIRWIKVNGQHIGVLAAAGDDNNGAVALRATGSGGQAVRTYISAHHNDTGPWDVGDQDYVQVILHNIPGATGDPGDPKRMIELLVTPDDPLDPAISRILLDSQGNSDFSSAPAREQFDYTTAVLASGAVEEGVTPGAAIYRLWRVETDQAARVRVYTDTTRQAADAARAIGTDPTGDHGCLLDFVTTPGDLDWVLTPQVDGVTLDESSDVPITVTNLDASAAVTVTLYAIV